MGETTPRPRGGQKWRRCSDHRQVLVTSRRTAQATRPHGGNAASFVLWVVCGDPGEVGLLNEVDFVAQFEFVSAR